MKKFFPDLFFSFFVLLISSATGFAQHKKDILWVDKFDTSNYQSLSQGKWYTFSDSLSGGGSTIKTQYLKDKKNQYLQYTFSLHKEKWQWDPYVALACDFNGKQELDDSIAAIAYEFKGSSHSFLYRTSAVTDYANFQHAIPASKEWTTVVIPLAALSQPAWGKAVPLHAKEVTSLAWQVSGKNYAAGDVSIDNVRLLRKLPKTHLSKTPPQETMPMRIDSLHLSSSFAKQATYDIVILFPPHYDEKKAYPVLYNLDWILWENVFKKTYDSLSWKGSIQDIIVVGIKVNATTRWGLREHYRDFTPDVNNTKNASDTVVTALCGGGIAYLNFIKQQVIAPIEKKYNTDTTQRTVMGASLSGLYTSYLLQADPHLFHHYIIGSPSLWFNNFEWSDSISNLPPQHLATVKHVVLSIGGKESHWMFQGYARLRDDLEAKGVKVTSTIYNEENHTSVNKYFIRDGLLHIFKK